MDKGALLDALERGSLVLPRIPGRADFLEIPGILCRSTEVKSPFVNLVANTRLDETNADATIQEVVRHFEAKSHPVGWMLGPHSRPLDIAKRLEAHGFLPLASCEGYALTNLDASIPIGDGVRIEEITRVEDLAPADELKSATFDIPLPVARWINELLVLGTGSRARLYIARIDGEPAAFAQTFYVDATGIIVLGGGGVLPKFRGRGVFRALVAHRLRDARIDGMKAATIQAWSHSSAPIVRRLGFELLCQLELLQWAPKGTSLTGAK